MSSINNISSLSSSLQGIQQAQKLLNKSAQEVATGSGELEKTTTEQIVAESSQAANINVIETREEMLDELMKLRK